MNRVTTRTTLLILTALLLHSPTTTMAQTNPSTAPATLPSSYSLVIDLDTRFQGIDHFAASDCWSMQKIGAWSEANRKKIADLLFSVDKGIGLSMWRFNIGGGINNETIRDRWRTAETFEVEEGKYDWSRQANERWFLGAAKARGVRKFLAFVNSPPGRMTRSGLTNAGLPGGGGSIRGSTNLKPDFEPQFARYLGDILEHFAANPDESQRITFDWVSPVNEPAVAWERGQEGNRAGNDDIKRIVRALYAELTLRKLPTRILIPEAHNIHDLVRVDQRFSRQHGASYGGYLDDFDADAELGAMVNYTLAYHSYRTDGKDQLVEARRALRAKLDEHPKWTAWQTEYCVLSGGRDLGMESALNVARLIHTDLTVASAAAWAWWLSVSPYDYKDGLIHTDWKKPGDAESIIEPKLLWAMGNFSRFVRPGMVRVAVRVAVRGAEENLNGVLASAYHDASSGRVAVVCINMSEQSPKLNVRVSTSSKGAPPARFVPHVTSGRREDDLKTYPAIAADEEFTLPPRSVVTLVNAP
jgi:hypothetical protein